MYSTYETSSIGKSYMGSLPPLPEILWLFSILTPPSFSKGLFGNELVAPVHVFFRPTGGPSWKPQTVPCILVGTSL
jgi:hypothetical protein